MLLDAEHFKSKISGIDGGSDTGNYIVQLVQDKQVPKTVAPNVAQLDNGTPDGSATLPEENLVDPGRGRAEEKEES